MKLFTALTLSLKFAATVAASPGNCIANESINQVFAEIINGEGAESYDVEDGSCCQETICGLGCPEQVDDPSIGNIIICRNIKKNRIHDAFSC